VLESGPAVQGIVIGPGDRLFDEAKVKVKQFLGLREGDDRGFALTVSGQGGAFGSLAARALRAGASAASGILSRT
jgi:hypothetical protein